MKNVLIIVIALFFISSTASATTTTIVVRAKAKDAKFIGSSIGGARIIIRDAVTEEIMTEGFTTGSTGNTDRIMKQPHQRHQALADGETAAFTASLNIEKPRLLTIEGFAPWAYPQARIKVQSQVWLIPGKHITGDGIVLEFPGLVVDIVNPQILESFSSAKEISLSANVVLMCGCPITEGGLWDGRQYEVQAIIEKDGRELIRIPLQMGTKPNTYLGSFLPKQAGSYVLTVYAYHSITGNTGVETIHFSVK